MRENISFDQNNESTAPKKEYLQGLGGISAQLEEVFHGMVVGDALQRPEFADAAQLVADLRDIVKHDDGGSLDVPEAVNVLRIIAKGQEWNKNEWDWDIIRSEAAKMNYQVREKKTSKDIEMSA